MKRLGPFAFSCLFMFISAVPVRAADDVDFGRQIRPLLAEKCFQCHGLDQESRETDLRLDTRDGLFAALESGGVAVAPGKPDESVLLQRLTTDDEDLRMPPLDSKKTLSDDEIDLVRRWIKSGAQWEQHWSLVKPKRPGVPQVNNLPAHNKSWPRNEIDAFVAARLEREGLAPSDEADRVRLIRRATYDLIGLPPTPEEIDGFLNDDSAVAYEKVIDRLLKSPHYGEHKGRYWLDAARYGDTHGLHLDNVRLIWPYRDWVINAFNANLPFDQFTIEQLAGDLLPNPTLDQQVATGFNRCNVTTSEGGAIADEYLVHYTNDRVATMSTVWMGISMGCVTCHDHKFDPFTMKDYYQLYGFFNSLDGPVMDGNRQDTAPVVKVATNDQRAELADIDRKLAELAKAMISPIPAVDEAQRKWEARLQDTPQETAWIVLSPDKFTSQGGATLKKLPDDSILASGPNPAKEVYEFTATADAKQLTAVRLEGLVDKSLPKAGAGRSSNSNVVLTGFEIEVGSGDDKWTAVKIARAWADHEQTNGDFKVSNAIDGNPATGWATQGYEKIENRTAVFVAESPFGFESMTRVRIRLRHESQFGQHQFGRIRLALTTAPDPQIGKSSLSAEIAGLIQIAPDKRNDAQQQKLRDYYRNNVSDDASLKKQRDETASLKKRKADVEKAIPTTLVWKEMAQPKPAFVLTRGAYDKPGDKVERNTPAALPPLGLPDGELPNRLHLARWLMSPDHPLTSRVTVNRIWQQYFGKGIVETTEDFGAQGSQPSHPELLDWLAVDFRESGWDLKRLHKMIVMSATYRQSSRVTPESWKRDRDNRLLARGPRFRLDGEMIRDTALAVSGLLVRQVGGPSVKPYQPDGIWYAVGYTDSNTARFKRDSGTALYRRTMYTFWKRTAPPPTMVTLDAPSRETCTVRRSRTNTPLAALALMNDEQFVETSRHLAQRMMHEGGKSDEERASFAFRLATSRQPEPEELAVLMNVYRGGLERYQNKPDTALELLNVGEAKFDDKLDRCQLAAWTVVANLILNLDETITKG